MHHTQANAPLLLAALRQAALSKWLQHQAAPRASAALEEGLNTGQGLQEPALHAVGVGLGVVCRS